MSTCRYCGASVPNGSQFCRGHNIAYRNRLIKAQRNGRDFIAINGRSVCVATELSLFGWGSQVVVESAPQSTSYAITGAFRKFGIELETIASRSDDFNRISELAQAEGTRINSEGYNHSTRRHWKLVTDGSLHGGVGREFVSPPFEDEDKAREDILRVCESMDLFGLKVNNTCGFHVHLDASDLTAKQIARVVKFYRDYEEQIDELHQRSRRGNSSTYTGTLRGSDFNPDTINSLSQLTRIYSSRYLKVNLCAYARHGTLEFRQHGGTINYTKIMKWVKLCTRIVEYAKTDLPIDPSIPLETALNLTQAEKLYWAARKRQLA